MSPSSSFQKTARIVGLFCLTALFSSLSLAAEDPPQGLIIQTDRIDAVYSVNERVTFKITLKPTPKEHDSEVLVNWTLSADGQAPKKSGQVTLKGGVAEITGQLATPGFLRLEAVLPKQEGVPERIRTFAGAAVSPFAIKPSQAAPDDFDRYWAQQMSELRSAPFEVKLTPVELPAEKSDFVLFDLQAEVPGGIIVSGYLSYPKGAAPGSLPAFLSVHGAGVRSSIIPTSWASEGMIALDINAHGIPNGKPSAFYKALADGELKNYPRKAWKTREEVYFLTMFLRVLAALDILTDRPEWDGQTLITRGTSQGGAQSLAAAALDSRVTLAVAGVSAMCDLSGMTIGRATGWPRSVPIDSEGHPDAEALQAMRYYDMVNFASRIEADVVMTVGFIDATCPPTTVYTAYNNLNTPKRIFNDLPTAHKNSPEAHAFMKKEIREHIQKQSTQNCNAE